MEPVVSKPRRRRRRVRGAAFCLAAAGVVCAGLPSPAHAATAGAETITGVFVDLRGDIHFPLIARGPLTAVGYDEPLESEPGDTPDLYRDRMVFPQGSVLFVHRRDVNVIDLDPETCVATTRLHGTWEISEGTGALAGATGSGTVTGSGHGIAQRVDGQCSTDVEPLVLVEHVLVTGTLSLPALGGS